MVNPLETRLIKPARLAHPGMLFQGHGLWLYPGNEKKHACSNPDIPEQKRSHAKAQSRKKTYNLLATKPGPNLLRM